MKILLDMDETITAQPEFFSAFSHAMKNAGHEIHVVTARDPLTEKLTKDELSKLNISYDVLSFDYEKLTYCEKNGIDVAFDDGQFWFHGKRWSDIKIFFF